MIDLVEEVIEDIDDFLLFKNRQTNFEYTYHHTVEIWLISSKCHFPIISVVMHKIMKEFII